MTLLPRARTPLAATLVLVASMAQAAGPANERQGPCGAPDVTRIPLEQDRIPTAISLASGSGAVPDLVALAVETAGADGGASEVHVRFVPGGGAGAQLPESWSWVAEATAVLGPGTGPVIARLPGSEPSWLVMMARPEATSWRPVAVSIRLDGEARRLELDSLVLGAVDHVFGPRPVAEASGAALVWGESDGAKDRILSLPWPAQQDGTPSVLASGRLGDGIAARLVDGDLTVAWIEPSAPDTKVSWTLSAGIWSAGGKPVTPAAALASWERPPRLIGLHASPGAVTVQLLVPDPVGPRVVTVTTGPALSDPASGTAKYPSVPVGSSTAGATRATGEPVLIWTGTPDEPAVVNVWTGGAAWIAAGGPVSAPLAIAPSKDALIVAWTEHAPGEKASVVVGGVAHEDGDSDTVPDAVDLCPDIPETRNSRVDHDGCPDPDLYIISPLETDLIWFPVAASRVPCAAVGAVGYGGGGDVLLGSLFGDRSVAVPAGGPNQPLEGLPGPVTSVVPLGKGGWIVTAAGRLFTIGADGSSNEVELKGPAAGGSPEAGSVTRLAQDEVLLCTDDGAALFDEGTGTPQRWMSTGRDIVAGARLDSKKILLLDSSGKLHAHDESGDEVLTIINPSNTHDDEPVGLVVTNTRIHVAWRGIGVYSRPVKGGKWKRLPPEKEKSPVRKGARSIAGLPGGDVVYVDANGVPWRLAGDVWRHEAMGARIWGRGVFADPVLDRIFMFGSDGRTRVLGLYREIASVTVGAEHFSGAKIKAGIASVLSEALAKLKSGKAVVRIEGHTDATGTSQKNQALSLKRARAIAAWLVEQGVPEDAIVTVGYGELFPIDDPEALVNRRVVLRLLEP